MHRASIFATSAFALVACWTLGCEQPKDQSPSDGARPPNILWVTIDTSRADHIGAYGYFRDTSPRFDAYAEESLLFERCITPMATTLPTHISALTATYPNEHGVLANIQVGGKTFTPSAKLISLAGFLRARDYNTAAFTSATTLKLWSGIQRGFGVYDPSVKEMRPGDETTNRALEWLSQNSQAPFFLWVHMFDVHSPHEAPAGFDLFKDGAPDQSAVDAYRSERKISDTGKRWRGDTVDTREEMNAYDAEIRFADQQLGRLLDALKASGLAESTAVVVMGDHGEGMGQHDFLRHDHVWGEQLHTPLLMHVPGVAPRRVPQLVSIVDVFPTLLGMIDIPYEEQYLANVSGIDVLNDAPESRAILSQTSLRLQRYGIPFTYSLTTADWKFISDETGNTKLFDLHTDPFELSDISSDQPTVVAELQAELDTQLAMQAKRHQQLTGTDNAAPDAVELDSATIEELKALGYIDAQ
ncbi:MAG: arylsulfatase A-like enzyme [Myxococcota bacterium]|jgi:arylsulfatase A-like enzyme